MNLAAVLPSNLSEATFQGLIVDAALLYRWRCVHYRPARTARGWATALSGHPGGPDLLLGRDGHVLCVEVKTQRGRATPDQRLWLAALGGNARLWRPSDWPTILAELRYGPTDIGEQR